MLLFSGCGKKYKVDYCGQKDMYPGARDSYRAGAQVELKFPYIATDTDYSFYLDGERMQTDYRDGDGFILRFTMPDHDVTVECRSYNSMVAPEPVTEPVRADELLVDYYYAIVGTDGGDRHDELALYRAKDGSLYINRYSGGGNGEEVCTGYRADENAVTQCYELIKKYKLSKWNDMEGDCIDGAVTVVKFRNDDGTYTRTSTDNYPSSYGMKAYGEIQAALLAYVTEENRIAE